MWWAKILHTEILKVLNKKIMQASFEKNLIKKYKENLTYLIPNIGLVKYEFWNET